MPLADYEIISKIGNGMNGSVYKALDVANKREVAIKITKTKSEFTKDEIANYIKMSHLESIPKMYEYFEVDKFGLKETHIVLEIIRGDDFLHSWKEYKNWDFIWSTIYHFIIAIRDFHMNGYIHGDIHAGNIMWTGDGVKFIDISHTIEYEVKKQIIREGIELMEKDFAEEDSYEDYKEDFEIESTVLWDEFYSMFCADFLGIFNEKIHKWLLHLQSENGEFSNHNMGHERFKHLWEWTSHQSCPGYDDNSTFGTKILEEYEKINNLSIEELDSYTPEEVVDYTREFF